MSDLDLFALGRHMTFIKLTATMMMMMPFAPEYTPPLVEAFCNATNKCDTTAVGREASTLKWMLIFATQLAFSFNWTHHKSPYIYFLSDFSPSKKSSAISLPPCLQSTLS